MKCIQNPQALSGDRVSDSGIGSLCSHWWLATSGTLWCPYPLALIMGIPLCLPVDWPQLPCRSWAQGSCKVSTEPETISVHRWSQPLFLSLSCDFGFWTCGHHPPSVV